MSRSVPIFVDDTGRRRRLVRRLAMVATSVSLGYVVVLAATLVGLPGLSRLPVPGVADLRGPADPARASIGERTVEEQLPDLAPLPTDGPAPPGTSPTTAARGGAPSTTSSAPPPAGAPSTAPLTSGPSSTATTTTAQPGRGSTTTTAVPPGRGSTTTTAPSATPTSDPGRAPGPPSTRGPGDPPAP